MLARQIVDRPRTARVVEPFEHPAEQPGHEVEGVDGVVAESHRRGDQQGARRSSPARHTSERPPLAPVADHVWAGTVFEGPPPIGTDRSPKPLLASTPTAARRSERPQDQRLAAGVISLQCRTVLRPTSPYRRDGIGACHCFPAPVRAIPVAQLRDAECLRTLVHRPFGRAELELVDHMAVVRESQRADGLVAWTAMIGSAASAIPRSARRLSFASGPTLALGVAAAARPPTQPTVWRNRLISAAHVSGSSTTQRMAKSREHDEL